MEVNLNADTGEVINILLRRTKEGVQVDVRVSPEVEEFFRRWGGGRREDTRAVGGRYWKDNANQPLLFWVIAGGVNQRGYMLNSPGSPLISEDDGDTPNISFLQLEGASNGRSFTCDQVLSLKELERLRGKIGQACGTFYNDYIKPANMQVVISTKQTA